MTRAATRPRSLADRGYDVTAANVVVSATHDHAAPTIQGSGATPTRHTCTGSRRPRSRPSSRAEANAHDAELWSATGTIHGLLSQVQGTDQMAGFAVDDSLPILWAREPGTGATLGLYANVPVHADQYNSTAPGNNQFTADYPGYVRDQLAKTLGGTSVIAMGTLGRQEGIGAIAGLLRGQRAGPLRHQRADARPHARASHHRHDARARRRSRSRPRPRTPGCSRRCRATTLGGPLRLPGPAHRAGLEQPGRYLGLARRRRDLHDQPLARRLRTSRRRPRDRHARRRSPASAIRCTPPPRVKRSRRSPTRSSVRSPRPMAFATCTSSITPATSSATTGTRGQVSTRLPSSPRATSPSTTSGRTSRRTTSTRSVPPAQRSDSIRPRRTPTPRSTTRTRSPSRRSSSTPTGLRPTIPR